ncbi:MAG TPA: NUDIX hydrolase [Spirochaetia bacterium]|nr:NUDIX hydrolase [Spirochaetia bacterium]
MTQPTEGPPHHESRAPVDPLEALRAAFCDYRIRYPEDERTVTRFLALLSHGEPAFHRDHMPGHFTASALVLDRELTRVLLTHHRKLDIWIQLGGHADGQADLLSAALREAREESGIERIDVAHPAIVDLDIHPIPPHGRESGHDHFDVRYAFYADPTAPLIVSDESHDLAWVAIERLSDFSDEESLHRAVERALKTVTQLADGPT